MTDDELRGKFDALSEPFLTSRRRERIREAVWNLERFEAAADFMRLLVADEDLRGAER
jgi:hypothetical protein